MKCFRAGRGELRAGREEGDAAEEHAAGRLPGFHRSAQKLIDKIDDNEMTMLMKQHALVDLLHHPDINGDGKKAATY